MKPCRGGQSGVVAADQAEERIMLTGKYRISSGAKRAELLWGKRRRQTVIFQQACHIQQ